ncbi:hypothetical protein MSAN_02054100 [Mycena sanguinolenta]|uniref:Uncharacterized protein n=1 Tax=Mycena sanguinolenta TaxID=230812 RepID=A0A8H6XJD2_9AGAR|nr:hypothetical protein MSAN_02054100 [Mycena sanguinolenta]
MIEHLPRMPDLFVNLGGGTGGAGGQGDKTGGAGGTGEGARAVHAEKIENLNIFLTSASHFLTSSLESICKVGHHFCHLATHFCCFDGCFAWHPCHLCFPHPYSLSCLSVCHHFCSSSFHHSKMSGHAHHGKPATTFAHAPENRPKPDRNTGKGSEGPQVGIKIGDPAKLDNIPGTNGEIGERAKFVNVPGTNGKVGEPVQFISVPDTDGGMAMR